MKNKVHFEHQNSMKHLDESISNIGGAPRMAAPPRVAPAPRVGGGMPVGGGFRGSFHGGAQQHLAYLKRNLPQIGVSHRQIGISPMGINFYKSGGGVLFGYPFAFWYPLFYAIYNGALIDEEALRRKYNLSDEEWYDLMDKLNNSGYITIA